MLFIGYIVHIGKTFESYDGVNLANRFMCIIGLEDNNILMLPMSTFHNEKHKEEKLRYKSNFPYLKIHGNSKDGYIKCNQLYYLSLEDFNRFSNEIQLKKKMELKHFSELIENVQDLKKDNKLEIIGKNIIFKDEELENTEEVEL